MTNTRSAAATGLPATTRRRALASLAGFGVVLSLPKVAKAAAGLDAPDAVLIAHASMVEDMANKAHAAMTRTCDLENEVERLMPIASRPDDGMSTRLPVDPAAARAVQEQQDAYAAWEAEREAVRERIGVEAANELSGDLLAALRDVVADLTPMAATTLAGLAAKARAALALDPHQDLSMDEGEQALFVSLALDAAAIGGAA